VAQAAFGHATGSDRKRLVYTAFFRSVNDPDLQRYWLATKVSSIEKVLEVGEAYFQVEEPRRPSYTARQVVKEDEETTPPPTPQVAAAATKSTEQTQLTMLMDMVKGLQSTVTKLQRDQADRRAPRLRDDPARPFLLTCWGCGMQGHVR